MSDGPSPVIDYMTVTGRSEMEFDKKIKELLAHGWQPYEGPFFGPGNYLVQAMVKRGSHPKPDMPKVPISA
jgi:hypothetical protein